MIISLIVAHGKNREIGVANELPWRLSGDLKLFKQNTLGKAVAMGRKTYESIGRPLPDRINIVLTRNKKFEHADGLVVLHSEKEILKWAYDHNVKELMVIGGNALFKMFYPYADRLYLTEVEGEFAQADTFFPLYDVKEWTLKERFYHPQDQQNEFAWTFNLYEKEQIA